MIRFDKLRLYTQTTDMVQYIKNPKKPYVIFYFSENSFLLKDYPYLNIRKADVRSVVVPITKIPRTRMSTEQRKIFKQYKLMTYTPNQNIPHGLNIIYDFSNYLYAIDTIQKPQNYRQRAGYLIKSTMDSILSNLQDYEKILLYSINLTNDLPTFLARKSFLLLQTLKDQSMLFDHLLFNTITEDKTQYRLLMKDKEFNLQRIILYLKKSKAIDTESQPFEQSEESSIAVTTTIKSIIKPENTNKISSAIKDFLEQDPESLQKVQDEETTHDDMKDIATAAVLFRINNNIEQSKRIAKNITPDKKESALKAIEKQYADQLLESPKPISTSEFIINQKFDIPATVENKSPEHLFQKRQIDFEVNLQKDMQNSFRVLETKEVPLKVTDMKFIDKPQKAGELDKSDIITINVSLKDEFNNQHLIALDIPKIQSDGTFTISGRKKCLINQIVLCPITFLKPYDSKFESSYSAFHIQSKQTKREKYLLIYMASYKLPLIILLAFSFGLKETLKKYGIGYKIVNTKPDKDIQYFSQIKNDTYIIFENVNTDLKKQLCQGFIRNNFLNIKTNKEFGTKEYFNDMIYSLTGRINSTFLIQSNLENIVDPVVKQVLINQQLPYDLENIMEYMAVRVVEGFVQARSDISNQRIRNSEVLVHLAQKQILGAYTEYKEKVLSGNTKAEFQVSQTKLLSDFINSEIVQDMEYANPIEEMSVKTRISPVGKSIGGIPDKGAITLQGRNVHNSHYGNIDPLDTPEGENIGIIQHLTIDAYLTSTRGMFHTKPIEDGENAGLLSTSTCMIPFVEKNDGPRVMFGANQARQSVPLKNPEPPVIQSGYESLLTNVLSDAFIKRSPIDGKIIKITSDQIIIQGQSKEIVDITPVHLRSGSGKDTLSVFQVKVKEGQTVKNKQIVAEGSCISNGSISLGRTLLVAAMPWKGYNFEDGIVVSDALFKHNKLTSLHGIIEEVTVSTNDRILEIVNIGDVVGKGNPLIRKTIGDVEELLGFEESENEDMSAGQYIKKSPGGTIVDIEVYSNVPPGTFPMLQPLIERTRKKNNVKPNEKFTVRGVSIKGILIKFKIEQELPINVGDKLTNRFGGKGVVAIVEKEENMPILPNGDKVEMIINPIGIVNRMNMGQYYEIYCGLISKEIANRIIKNPSKASTIALLNQVFTILDVTKNKQMSSKFINQLQRMSEAEFKLLVQQISQTKFVPMVIPPFKGPSYKEISQVLKVLGLKRGYKLKLPEYNTTTINDVPVGYMYYLKLEHIGSEKIHSRSTGPVVSKTMQPTAGKRQEGGQRMGEMDTYALASYNAPMTLAEFFGPLSDDQVTKNEMITEIIQNGEVGYKEPKVNPTRDLLSAYFVALMLGGR